jgi:glycosyltransferase involved in cell wall biosynthesis
MMRKKVGMVVTNGKFPDDIRVFKEAVTLSKDYSVSVIVWDHGENKKPHERLPEGIEVFRIRLNAAYSNSLQFVSRLPVFWLLSYFLLFKLKVDAVHCHDLDTLPLGVTAKLLNPRLKLIFDSHEHYPSMISDRVPKPVRAVISMLFTSLPRLADGVIVVNDYLKGCFKKCRKVVVVMNTPPLDEGNQVPSAADPASHDGFNVLYFGGLYADRGVGILLDAAEKLPDVTFIIAGDGIQKTDVIQRGSICPNIKYLGYIPFSKILCEMAAADLIPIFYSSDILNNKIATPNKLFLAMSFGKPVVVYTGTLTESIVREEDIGFAIDEEHALEELINTVEELRNDKPKVLQIAQNGHRAFEERYNWEVMESRLRQLYKEVLAR